jgi:catechol 2,3-dioxygenase-like lactoylglutathione lyase family enzyme
MQATVAIRVADLARSIHFYTEGLGFSLAEHRPAEDVAEIIDSDGDPFLLAGPHAGDLAPYLAEGHFILRPGTALSFLSRDLGARHAQLAERGLTEEWEEQTAWGDRTLSLRDPDGYVMQFIRRAERSPEETLTIYAQGPEELEEAMAGLAEADLDLAPAAGEWSIRQIVHHTADGDCLFLMPIKTALAQPGSTCLRPPFENDTWAQALDYARRPITPALALQRAIRVHVAELLRVVPSAWERTVALAPQGRQIPVGELVTTMAQHALEHAGEIRAIRRAHGR